MGDLRCSTSAMLTCWKGQNEHLLGVVPGPFLSSLKNFPACWFIGHFMMADDRVEFLKLFTVWLWTLELWIRMILFYWGTQEQNVGQDQDQTGFDRSQLNCECTSPSLVQVVGKEPIWVISSFSLQCPSLYRPHPHPCSLLLIDPCSLGDILLDFVGLYEEREAGMSCFIGSCLPMQFWRYI